MFPVTYYPNTYYPVTFFANGGSTISSSYGFLSDFYETEETVSADFRNKANTILNGVVTPAYSGTTTLTVNGLLWTGSMIDKIVSEKDRADIEAVFVFNYEDYTATVKDNAKVTIGGKEYSVITVDNIANQNGLMQVPLKEFK